MGSLVGVRVCDEDERRRGTVVDSESTQNAVLVAWDDGALEWLEPSSIRFVGADATHRAQ